MPLLISFDDDPSLHLPSREGTRSSHLGRSLSDSEDSRSAREDSRIDVAFAQLRRDLTSAFESFSEKQRLAQLAITKEVHGILSGHRKQLGLGCSDDLGDPAGMDGGMNGHGEVACPLEIVSLKRLDAGMDRQASPGGQSPLSQRVSVVASNVSGVKTDEEKHGSCTVLYGKQNPENSKKSEKSQKWACAARFARGSRPFLDFSWNFLEFSGWNCFSIQYCKRMQPKRVYSVLQNWPVLLFF